MLKNLRIGVRLSLLVALLCAAQVAVGKGESRFLIAKPGRVSL